MTLNTYKVAQGLDDFRVANYVDRAAQGPDRAITQILDTIDEANQRQIERMEKLDVAYKNLASSLGSQIRDQIGQVPTPNLAALRDRLVASLGASGEQLLTLLFTKVVDSAFSHYGRIVEDISNRILRSISVYAEMFFRSDQLIVEACAAYLSELMVAEMRAIANEMGAIEQVLVKTNAIARDLEALDYALRGIPASGPDAFLKSLRHVQQARTAIAEGLMAIEDTGAVHVNYIRRARHSVRSAQTALPKAPIGPDDLKRLQSLLLKLDELRTLIEGFNPRLDTIAKHYVRILGYAAMIRNLPAALLGEARLLKIMAAELSLRTVDGQLSSIEDRMMRYAMRSDMDPPEVYYHATIERVALEIPYLELLSLERIFHNSNVRSSSYERLLKILEDPFFHGDPFAEFKRLVGRYRAMSSKAAVSSRMLRYSTRIMTSYRGLRSKVVSLASRIEDAAPRGQAVTATTEAIKGIMTWVGVRNPMMVVSSGAVVITLLTKQGGIVRSTVSAIKDAVLPAQTIDAANAFVGYVEGSADAVTARIRDLSSSSVLEPLAMSRPFFRPNSDAKARSRATTEAICAIRTDSLVGMDIAQIITDQTPQYDQGRARGFQQIQNQTLE